MKICMALTWIGISLAVIAQVQCSENTVIKRIDDLGQEVVDVRGDLFRLEGSVLNQINFAKISLKSELMQHIKQYVRDAMAELLQGKPVEEMVKSQVVSEVRQLKRGDQRMKRQLHHVLNSLRDIQEEREVYNKGLRKAERDSGQLTTYADCVVVTGDTDVKPNSFMNKLSRLEQSVTNHTAELQTTRTELTTLKASYNSTGRELVSVRSDMASTEARLNATKQGLLSTNSEVHSVRRDLDIVNQSLNARRKEVMSVSSEMESVQRDLNSTKQKLISTSLKLERSLESTSNVLMSTNQTLIGEISRLNALTGRTIQLETHIFSTGRDVSFQVWDTRREIHLSNKEVLKFKDVTLNAGNAYNPKSGIFTTPVTGTYFFWANILTWGADSFAIKLMRDDQLQTRAYTGSHQRYGTAIITYMIKLKKGEHVWFANQEMGGVRTNIQGDSYSNYGGTLLYV